MNVPAIFQEHKTDSRPSLSLSEQENAPWVIIRRANIGWGNIRITRLVLYAASSATYPKINGSIGSPPLALMVGKKRVGNWISPVARPTPARKRTQPSV